MRAPFPDEMFNFLLQWEGTWLENDEDDPGGMTKYGIDARSHPGVDIAALTERQAHAIYSKEWNESPAPSLGRKLRLVYFDSCVNCGRRKAWEWLERHTDATAYLAERDRYYNELCDAKPVFKKYLHGWLNRTKALRRLCESEA